MFIPGINFNPTVFVGLMLGFVIGTTFHEFMHAYSALLLGDDLARSQGRVTLNPTAHFDPMGFFMGVLLALGVPALAWGKPVMVNPYALRYGRRGMAIVAIAGPLANIAFAAVLAPIYQFGTVFSPDARAVIYWMILINLWLFAFNLIPIPPLDGFNILTGILPNAWNIILEPIRRYSLVILLGLVFLVPMAGRIIGIYLNPLSAAIAPVQQLLQQVFLG